LQAHKPKNGLDPAQYKPTAQLLVEITSAAESAASAGSSSQAGKRKKKAKKQGGLTSDLALEEGKEPTSRADLRLLLERRIKELKEERAKKQSDADIQQSKAEDREAHLEQKRAREEAEATASANKQRLEAKPKAPVEDDVEAGRLTFEPRLSELPYDAQVNRKGHKVRQLRKSLGKAEAKVRKMADAEETGDKDELRTKYALDTALRRARGEKVHNDISRMRKVQKQLETRKSKGKDKWEARVEDANQKSKQRQDSRKYNIQARRLKKSAHKDKKAGRVGFEGKGDMLGGHSGD